MGFQQTGPPFTQPAGSSRTERTPPPSARAHAGLLLGTQARDSRNILRRESTDGVVEAPWWCDIDSMDQDKIERLFHVWSQPLRSRCKNLEVACSQLTRRLDAIEPCIAETKTLESQVNMLGLSVLACSDAVRMRLMEREEKSETHLKFHQATPADLHDVFADTLVHRVVEQSQKLGGMPSEKQARQLPSGHSSSNILGHSAEPDKLQTHFAKAFTCRPATAAERLSSAPVISDEGHRMLDDLAIVAGTKGIEGGFIHSSAAKGISFHNTAACVESTLPQGSAELQNQQKQQKQQQRQAKQQQRFLTRNLGGLLQMASGSSPCKPLLHTAGSLRLVSEQRHASGKESPQLTRRQQQSPQQGRSTTSSDSHTRQSASWAELSVQSMV
mmetsp:Transcript_73269/g.141728  ORF Transcript_73269/g.141728 Transcript_73269/m.141728 type:complete len:386 (-) Transcript_73269:323-1480(-)